MTDFAGLARMTRRSAIRNYPGSYRGRTVHIHVKVHAGGSELHTGRLYFDDVLSDSVYAQAPYSSHPGSDTN
jgi:hypothetical protein